VKFLRKSLEKSSDINQNCTSISKISKNYEKFEFLSQKSLFLGQKSLFLGQKSLFLGQKVRKKFGKSSEKFGNRVFRMFENFGNCSIPNFPKITKK